MPYRQQIMFSQCSEARVKYSGKSSQVKRSANFGQKTLNIFMITAMAASIGAEIKLSITKYLYPENLVILKWCLAKF